MKPCTTKAHWKADEDTFDPNIKSFSKSQCPGYQKV